MSHPNITIKTALPVIAVACVALWWAGLNMLATSRASTEARATHNAWLFAETHNIKVDRLSCAGDSGSSTNRNVQDGYGSCVIVEKSGAKIPLQCPTGFWQVNVLGATGCKEQVLSISLGR